MNPITSANNPRLKNAIRLHDSRGRKKQGRIIVFGIAEIQKALQAQTGIVEVFVPQNTVQELGEFNFRESVEIFSLPESLFKKLSFGQRNDGIIAVAQRPETRLSGISEDCSLLLVLDAIEKPGNVGAVFRSAVAAGVQAVVLSDPISDVFHPNAIRSSLGSVFSLPVACADAQVCQEWLHGNGFQIVTTRVDADREYTDFDLTQKTAIVLGNESNGVSERWKLDRSTSITIPMDGCIDSLNIAMSATLMAYEARRQRKQL